MLRMIYLRSTLIILASLVLLNNVQSQEPISIKQEFLIVTGYSPRSVIFLGKTPDASATLLKLEYRNQTNKSFLGQPLYYQFGLIPFIEFDYPKRDRGGRQDVAQGFGISPIGLGINNSISQKFSYSLYTFGGVILVEKKFPTDEGRKLNYTFSLSSSGIFKASKYLSFSLGYKFHHISNAQTGTENPGIDSNFITFSLILSK